VRGYTVAIEFAGALLLLLGVYTRYVSSFSLPVLIAVANHWMERKGFWFADGGMESTCTPASADRQNWPRDGTQILSSNVRSARSRQHVRPRFELNRSDRQRRLSFPNTLANAKSPLRPLHCRCFTPRDFVPWRFSDAGSERGDGLGMPASEKLHKCDIPPAGRSKEKPPEGGSSKFKPDDRRSGCH
jgi:hypothetical protein